MPARSLFLAAVIALSTASCLEAQSGRRSQLATVSQNVGDTRIEIRYRRPVARGRELFGSLVPWGKVWTPSADSAAWFSTSTDIDVNGSRLKAGKYAIWMIPDRESWTVIFSAHQPVFHLKLPEPIDEVLRITSKPTTADHMESLGFYFPVADADSATMAMHWGKTVVPVKIKSH